MKQQCSCICECTYNTWPYINYNQDLIEFFFQYIKQLSSIFYENSLLIEQTSLICLIIHSNLCEQLFENNYCDQTQCETLILD